MGAFLVRPVGNPVAGRAVPCSIRAVLVRFRHGSRHQATAAALAIACGVFGTIAACGAPARRPPATPRAPTIPDRVAQYGPTARARLAPYFAAAGVPYPPERFALLGFKRERELHLLAAGPGQPLAVVRAYPILGASGELGPKLREGDRQVPEGIYRIDYLNPNSIAHLSLGLSYPNPYDRARAAEDGRDTLGSAIMIHGGVASVGCLAIGDRQYEELFVLAADAGWENAVVVLSPVDFRRHSLPTDQRTPPTRWVGDLYARLRTELAPLPLEPVRAPSAPLASAAP